MSKQIFKLSQPAKQVLVDFLAQNNAGFNIPASELTFGNPVVTTAPAVNVAVDMASGYQGINYSGTVQITYNRLDLANYFQGVTASLDASQGTTTADVLAALMNRYQLYFTIDATGDDAFNECAISVDNTTTPPKATLTASANNLIWQGSVSFNLSGEQSLSSILPNANLTGLAIEPALTAGQSYAEAYYGTSYNTTGDDGGTPTHTVLAGLGTGNLPAQTDATPWALGVALTGDSWVIDSTTPGPFNASGAQVAYNGPATGNWILAGALAAQYTNVCVITLSSSCTNLVGNLVIPYNP